MESWLIEISFSLAAFIQCRILGFFPEKKIFYYGRLSPLFGLRRQEEDLWPDLSGQQTTLL